MATRPTRNTARLATILDHLPDALLLVDPAGLVVNANARALQAFRAEGASRPLVGRLLVDVLPGFGRVSDRPARRRQGAQAARLTERMLAQGLDGTTFPVDVSRTVVPWEGADDHLLLVLHEAVEAPVESELFRTSQQAQAVLRATEEAICGVDGSGKVVLANPAAARLFGARVGEIAGRDLHTLALHTRLDGSANPAGESPLGETLRTGRRQQRRREIVWRADGSPVPAEISTVAIKEGEEVVGAIAAITDVTRLVEEERRRLRLLDVLDTEVGPALAALAGDALADPASAAELERLRAAVADAIDYEHLMANKVRLAPTAMAVRDVIDEAVERAAPAAAARDVRLDVLIEPCTVAADGHRLALAIGELVRAAAASSAPGASVAVTTGVGGDRVRIGVRESQVADAGQENPLLRWLRPRRGRDVGPDPDLAFVQIVVERHGGRFLLEPASAGARSYVVELPLAAPAAEAPIADGSGTRRRHARGGAGAATPDVEGSGTRRGEPEADPAVADPAVADPAAVGAATAAPPAAAGPASAPAAAAAEPAVRGAARARAIPPPARPAGGSRSPASTAARPLRAVPDPPGSVGARKVLIWPSAVPAMVAAVTARGLTPVAVARTADVIATGRDRGAVLLVDPLAGPVSRRALADVRAAAAAARMPIVVAAGLAEAAAGDPVMEPAMLLAALRDATAHDTSRQAGGPDVARVLVLEEDPAIAAALGSGLLARGMHPVYARSESEAMLGAAIAAPDLVLLNLTTDPGAPPGIVDWLRNSDRLPATPLLVYTTDGLGQGHRARLERGRTTLAIGARDEGSALDARLADLIARVGAGR